MKRPAFAVMPMDCLGVDQDKKGTKRINHGRKQAFKCGSKTEGIGTVLLSSYALVLSWSECLWSRDHSFQGRTTEVNMTGEKGG